MTGGTQPGYHAVPTPASMPGAVHQNDGWPHITACLCGATRDRSHCGDGDGKRTRLKNLPTVKTHDFWLVTWAAKMSSASRSPLSLGPSA
jgi:hypothetical protein